MVDGFCIYTTRTVNKDEYIMHEFGNRAIRSATWCRSGGHVCGD